MFPFRLNTMTRAVVRPGSMTALCAVLSLPLMGSSVIARPAEDGGTVVPGGPACEPAPDEPVEVNDAISREFTVFVEQATSIIDAISREFTVFNDEAAHPTDAVSREFTVFNDIVNPVKFTDAVSREMTAFVVIPIELGVPYEGSLPVGTRMYFRLETPPDLTLRITLDHASETAWTELYASFGALPDEATADFSFSDPSAPDQELVIPNTMGGTYFVLVRLSAESDTSASSGFSLLAAGVPFGVDGVEPPVVGAGEEVTLRVTGGHLEDAARMYLRHVDSGAEIAPVKTDVLDAAHARLRFNFWGEELGLYNVISESQDTQPVVLEDAVTLQPPDEFHLDEELTPSPFLRSGHGWNRGFTTLLLRNNSNIDVPITLVKVFAPNGPDMMLTIEGGDPLPVYGNADYVGVQLAIESIGPSATVEVPIAIDVGPGFPGPNIEVLVAVETWARQAFRDIWIRGDRGLVRGVAEAYAASEPEDIPPEFWTEVVPAMQDQVAALFDEYGLDVPLARALSASRGGWPSKRQLCNATCVLLTTECIIVCQRASPGVAPWCRRYCASIAAWCALCCNDACNNVCPRKWIGFCPPPPPDNGCVPACVPAGPGCRAACVCREDCPRASDGIYYGEHCRPVCECKQAGCTPGGRSTDPNEKHGPSGYGDGRFVHVRAPLIYRLYFENLDTATAPAAEVFITDTLDPSMNLATFRIRQFQFGSTTVDVPEGRSSYQTTIDLTAEMDLLVQLQAGVNPGTGDATFVLRALDPETLQLPAELMRGFLPPNDETGRGEGYVEFTIEPRSTTPTGTVVINSASIVFDYNDPIETNEVFNTIDSGAPDTSVQVIAEESLTPFALEWDGTDDAGGSGLAEYRIYVRTNGGPAELWYSGTDTWAHFDGEVGSSYAFYSRGVDNVGNVEALPVTLDAMTTVVAVRHPGDIDADADTDLADFRGFCSPDPGEAVCMCMSGPNGESLAECALADLDRDRDVDLADFAEFQNAYAPPSS